jgi:ParB-like chromosome segregation protein Spo0J
MVIISEELPPEPEQETPDITEIAPEFIYVPIDLIQTAPQIRKDIDPEGESIRSLAGTIRERGMMQPLGVIRSGEGYLLVTGERRLLAARLLGLEKVPVRILEKVVKWEEILTCQLIENLQREDLDPIETAEGLLSLYQSRQGNVSLEEILNVLLTYDRGPERLPEAVAFTVNAIVNTSGKSISSLRRVFSLLRLPEEIRQALRTGKIGVSQGYLFAEAVDNPELMKIFNDLLTTLATNETLKKQLEAYKTKPAGGRPKQYRPFQGIYTSIKNASVTVGDATTLVTKEDLTKLLVAAGKRVKV